MEKKTYFIMTTEQKEMLEKILEALNIDIEDFLLVGNMRAYDEQIKKSEERLNGYEMNLIQLNNRIAELEQKLAQKEAEELYGVIDQNEE